LDIKRLIVAIGLDQSLIFYFLEQKFWDYWRRAKFERTIVTIETFSGFVLFSCIVEPSDRYSDADECKPIELMIQYFFYVGKGQLMYFVCNFV